MTKKLKEKCRICEGAINKEEDYVKLSQYDKGSVKNTSFYHTRCFKERFMNFQKIQDEANNLFRMTKPIVNQLKDRGFF